MRDLLAEEVLFSSLNVVRIHRENLFVLRDIDSELAVCTPVILCIKSVYIYLFRVSCISVYLWERNFHVSSNIILVIENTRTILFFR